MLAPDRARAARHLEQWQDSGLLDGFVHFELLECKGEWIVHHWQWC